jgi:hypothetical protein
LITKEQESRLFALRTGVDDDNIRIKEIIKQKLCESQELIHILETPDLDEDTPEDYVGKSILPFVRLPEIQYEVNNYICFQVDLIEDHPYNNALGIGNITFVIFCEEKNITTKYGIARHDLLGYLVKEIFNWSNIFGNQVKLVYDKESVTDTHFSCRTIKFELISPNSLAKTMAKKNHRVYNNIVNK